MKTTAIKQMASEHRHIETVIKSLKDRAISTEVAARLEQFAGSLSLKAGSVTAG
jgi:hypothetical protein